MNTIGKTEIIRDVAIASGLSQPKAKEVIDALLAQIAAHTTQGHKVSLSGFGSFVPKTRAARTARNPVTGAPVEVPEKTVLTFKPTKVTATA